MVDITRHPREFITPVWSKKSWVHNIFRVYEYWFGRKYGIRFEASYQEGIHIFGTWEALIAHVEGMIRAFFARTLPAFEVVRLPEFAFAGMPTSLPFRFAIAYGNAVDYDTSTSTTQTVTNFSVSGTNRIMFGLSVNAGVNLTGATYAASAFSVGKDVPLASNHWVGIYLVAPAVGTANAVATSAAPAGFGISYYTGASQTGIDQTDGATSASQGSTWTATVNTATSNEWLVAFYQGSNGSPSAGTNATGRLLANSGAGLPSAFDSNGSITTGGFSMTINTSNSGQPGGYVAMSFATASASAANSGFFFKFAFIR